ncbi:MAG TPA: hypothetical protein VL654_12240 [Casimicrobiaceae bacterium]|nr:hypothetical protein [Casimicrobiaceae bacterium]
MRRGIPKHRVILTLLMSFLLLFLQQESVRHALDHLGAQLERAKHSALERPVGDVCAECEMLAAGTAATPPSLPQLVAGAAEWIDAVAPVARASIPFPAFYSSRAPPQILQSA